MTHVRFRCIGILLSATVSIPQTAVGQAPEPVKVGKPHPPLALWTLEHDKPMSLEALRGKKVILIHFASWSEPSRQQIGGWFEHLRSLVSAKKVVVLGVDHEQHADRARLFAQWKTLKEPILHDPLDLSAVTKLPFVVAIDEEGVVRAAQPTIDKLDKGFIHRSAPRKKEHSEVPEAALPDPRVMRRTASEARKASVYRELGDALVLGGAPIQINEAIKTYKQVLQLDPKDAWSCFRMGTAYRTRYERDDRQPGDFQFAIDAWEDAVKLEPGCEIFRQRLRQYGPAVPDSEASYDWIPVARTELRQHGGKPIELDPEPMPSEVGIANPASSPRTQAAKVKAPADDKLIQIESTVVPSSDPKHAGVAEVHLTLRLNGAKWDNKEAPLRIWLEKPKNASLERSFLELANPKPETSDESRTVSFKVESKSKSKNSLTVKGVAVYCVRAGGDAKGRMLRQEFEVVGDRSKRPKDKAPATSEDE